MSAKPQFTPRQILDAGMRAEDVNQLDHAAQFYRFLLDHHANAPEAEAARDNLRRISGPLPGDVPQRSDTPTQPAVRPSAMAAANGASHPGSLPGSLSIGRDDRGDRQPGAFSALPSPLVPAGPAGAPTADGGYGHAPSTAPGHPPYSYPSSGSGYGTPAAQGGQSGYGPSAAGAVQPEPVRMTLPHLHLPEPVRHYGVGRFLAGVMIGFGGLGILGGAAVIGLSLAGPSITLPVPLPLGITTGVGAIVGGLALIFAGQAARALFDTANATRDLVNIVRAITDPHAGERRDR